MDETTYLDDAKLQLRKLKTMAERALEQAGDGRWFVAPDPDSNSLAVIMKHISGNLRSRWTRFLETDGEKPDRNRDGEFEIGPDDTPARLRERWEQGWKVLFETLESLRPGDLEKTVTIRREPHTVLQAINRQLSHYSLHVGQIIYLAKHLAGKSWTSMSIPKGKSKEFEVAKDGKPYLAEPR
ncbi:MAG TPA: DUF1572 family protein [Planctomycetota bacterium]|nr:DUF1572 family protein [Planctomycetota bacterium]